MLKKSLAINNGIFADKKSKMKFSYFSNHSTINRNRVPFKCSIRAESSREEGSRCPTLHLFDHEEDCQFRDARPIRLP